MSTALSQRPLKPAVARPFAKWAGGKTKLLPDLLARIPTRFRTYREPFFGGGALFWAMAAEGRITSAALNDTNKDLVMTCEAIRTQIEPLIAKLKSMKNTEDDYYAERVKEPLEEGLEPDEELVAVAARMIYLNKACFNGLHRVNKQGRFNVPWGKNPKATICDEENLRACHELLETVQPEITNVDFEEALKSCNARDFIYFDPPYLPMSKTANFTAYGADGFSWEDHERLYDVARRLKFMGVHVLVSNCAHERIKELWARAGAFHIEEVEAPRFVNSKGSGRGNVKELLIR